MDDAFARTPRMNKLGRMLALIALFVVSFLAVLLLGTQIGDHRGGVGPPDRRGAVRCPTDAASAEIYPIRSLFRPSSRLDVNGDVIEYDRFHLPICPTVAWAVTGSACPDPSWLGVWRDDRVFFVLTGDEPVARCSLLTSPNMTFLLLSPRPSGWTRARNALHRAIGDAEFTSHCAFLYHIYMDDTNATDPSAAAAVRSDLLSSYPLIKVKGQAPLKPPSGALALSPRARQVLMPMAERFTDESEYSSIEIMQIFIDIIYLDSVQDASGGVLKGGLTPPLKYTVTEIERLFPVRCLIRSAEARAGPGVYPVCADLDLKRPFERAVKAGGQVACTKV